MAASGNTVAPRRVGMRLPPEVNRILFVKSLPYKISEEDMYDIFGKYGAIRQIRLGNTNATRGTAYVVYEDIFQAKHACENLNGFQVAGRYLIVRFIIYLSSVFSVLTGVCAFLLSGIIPPAE